MSRRLLRAELLALPSGVRVSPTQEFKDENYIHRADLRHALRIRLAVLAGRGEFRMIGNDEWERT